jgi:hypothetical protein
VYFDRRTANRDELYDRRGIAGRSADLRGERSAARRLSPHDGPALRGIGERSEYRGELFHVRCNVSLTTLRMSSS